MSVKINEALEHFFKNYEKLERSVRLFVFREDGLILYQTSVVENKTASSCGALMGGTWQAAMTLVSFIGGSKRKPDDYRLSFDSSSEGVHIIAAGQYENYQLYLGGIYAQQVNPAPLKNKIKNLNFKLRACIDELSVKQAGHRTEENYLFSNITDSEIDAMFAVMEN